MEQKKTSGQKAKQVMLAIAIAIIFSLFIGFGISVFYPSPQVNDFCNDTIRQPINTQQQCVDAGGKWENYDNMPKVQPVAQDTFTCTQQTSTDPNKMLLSCETLNVTSPTENGYCNTNFYCMQDYNNKEQGYNKNVFIITLIIGIITILVSVALRLASVSTGLMGGGIITIIYGVIRYWQYSTDILRFIILGIVLAILIWLGYKRLNK